MPNIESDGKKSKNIKAKKDVVFKAPPDGWWTATRAAALATYNILENDALLNQFDRIIVPFDSAAEVMLSELGAMNTEGTAADQRGRAAQLARHFFRFVLELYSTRTEDAAFDGATILVSLRTLLLQPGATVAHLAYLIDGFIIFPGESGQ